MDTGGIPPGYGDFYTHPAFDDVIMEISRRFYVKEKETWKLKVYWWIRNKTLPSGKIRKGGLLAGGSSRLVLTAEKFREFKRMGGGT